MMEKDLQGQVLSHLKLVRLPVPPRPHRDNPRVQRQCCQIHTVELQTSMPLGASGRVFRRLPVASKIALPMAGATAMIGVSPAPAGAMSLRSSKIASISGTSRNLGTR